MGPPGPGFGDPHRGPPPPRPGMIAPPQQYGGPPQGNDRGNFDRSGGPGVRRPPRDDRDDREKRHGDFEHRERRHHDRDESRG